MQNVLNLKTDSMPFHKQLFSILTHFHSREIVNIIVDNDVLFYISPKRFGIARR